MRIKVASELEKYGVSFSRREAAVTLGRPLARAAATGPVEGLRKYPERRSAGSACKEGRDELFTSILECTAGKAAARLGSAARQPTPPRPAQHGMKR